MSEITSIQNEADYDAARARVSDLLDAELNTPEGDELDRLTDLVATYEDEHHPMGDPEPASALEFLLDQGIVSREQMEAMAGGSDHLDAILAGREAVTPAIAQLLFERMGIRANALEREVVPGTSD